jgi:long-chain acyl-CoA synthetase
MMTGAGRAARIISGERERPLALIHERAARAASGFRALGLGEGDTVALVLRNDFGFFEATIAAGLIGAYATPINWHFTADEAGYVLADSAARVVVAHSDLWPALAPALPPGVTALLVPTPPEIAAAYGIADKLCRVAPGGTSWDDWLMRHEKLAGPSAAHRASMIYTSGTTGRPKGVRRQPATEEQVQRLYALSAVTWGFVDADRPVLLMNGPMYHSAPNAYGMQAARRGYEMILQPRFDAEEMLALIERHRITHMHIVPTMFVRLLKLPEATRGRYDLASLRHVVHGAAPCPLHVKQAMIDWWGDVITEYYGSTETGIATWNSTEDARRKPGTVGRPITGAVVKVFDEAGNELPRGEIGELYMRAAHAPDFTYQNQHEKRLELERDALFTVGDIGWIDDEGYVFLCDRRRDMVISGGVNIYPAEIEAALLRIPGVKDCAVFGIPDEEYGESLCAYVEPDADHAALDPEVVRAALRKTLARYKIPKIIEIARDLPREDSGKIFKRKLREPYWAAVGRRI